MKTKILHTVYAREENISGFTATVFYRDRECTKKIGYNNYTSRPKPGTVVCRLNCAICRLVWV
jgi:hypothetical protein